MKTKKVFALLMAGLLALNATGISVLAETEENDSTETTEENALDPEDDFDGGGKKIRVGLSWEEMQSSINQAWQDYFMKYSEEYGKKHNCTFDCRRWRSVKRTVQYSGSDQSGSGLYCCMGR